jgi:glutamate-1-semialdehyde 2,1-aminomutase
MSLRKDKSGEFFARAKELMPGGVSSPVRAFKAVGGGPLFMARGEGAYITDADGNRFVDWVMSWGPLILGHAPARVVEAVVEAARAGTSFGAPTEREIQLAEMVRERVPSVERVRFVSSGTEATMSALRLARAATGRDDIVKLDGCYHGHGDSLLVKAGSGVETLGLPDSPGVPADLARHTLVLPFNDLDRAEDLFRKRGERIAALILEPVVGNMGVLAPLPGYLSGLRELCSRHGVVLIFDEVMTGFRVARGGAQELHGVTPDLSTFGKVIGGGLPVGAYGGRADIMKLVAPEGPVYQAGTLSGNPLAMAAGIATLDLLDADAYRKLEQTSAALEAGLRGLPGTRLNRVGSMWTLFFAEHEVLDAATARQCDTKRFARFHAAMLDAGIYLPPSQFEAAFISLAHGPAEVEKTVAAARSA